MKMDEEILCKNCQRDKDSLNTPEPGACSYKNWISVDGFCRGFEPIKKTKTCTRCVDRNSDVWFMDPDMGCAWGITILNNVRNDFRDRLFQRGFVTLIDILSYLHLPVSREALTLGWVWDDKEKFPDLDLFRTRNGDSQIPFDHKIKIEFVDLVDLSKILDPDTAII